MGWHGISDPVRLELIWLIAPTFFYLLRMSSCVCSLVFGASMRCYGANAREGIWAL